MTTRKEDGVDHVVQAHLAPLLLLQDSALLHPPPRRDPVLESDAAQPQDMFDLLGGQFHHLLLCNKGNTEHLQDLLSADRTLCQLLSTLVAGDQVAAVEEDAQSRTTTKMPTKTTPKGRK